MGVLTIDEAGEKRAFRISEGMLSIGSGDEVDLKLTCEDVALHHADLECKEETLYVVPKPGVVPPTVHGVELKKKTRLAPGQELRIGKARIIWQGEGKAVVAIPSASGPQTSSGKKSGSRSGSASRKRKKIAGVANAAPRSSSGRKPTRARSSQGLPAWLIVVGILGAVFIGGFYLWRGMEGNAEANSIVKAGLHLRKGEQQVAMLNTEAAQGHLDKIVRSALSAADRQRFEAVEQAIAAEKAQNVARVEEDRGDNWFEYNLEEYEKRHLSGDPGPAAARLFLDRCAEFRERWPKHSKMAWVVRQEKRFASLGAMDGPLGFDDVIWRAKLHTNSRPRLYGKALTLLEQYREKTEGSKERVELAKMVEKLKEERVIYHNEQLHLAKGEFEKGNTDRAINWLVQSILGLGDEQMENQAAEILIKFPMVENKLLGYREYRPDDYKVLSENQIIADFMDSKGL